MNKKTSRVDEARRVAVDLLDMLENSKSDIDAIILKAQRLARLMRDADAQRWLELEMRGYPNGFNFNEIGTCRKYAISCGRFNPVEKQYFLIGLPALAANFDSEQSMMSSAESIVMPRNAKDFTEKAATEALMRTQVSLQSSQKRRFSEAKQQYSSFKSGIHSFASDMYIALELGDAAQDIFESARAEIDRFVRSHCPQAAEKLVAINERIADGTAESLSAALTTCRRLLMTVADSLFPSRSEDWVDKNGKNRKVGNEQYKNRLLAYLFVCWPD